MRQKVCTSCGYIGKPIRQCYESFVVDIFVWLIVASVVFMTGLLPFLLIAVSWTTIHLLKFRSTKCPSCENLDMVSMKSAKGKAKLQHAV